MALQRSTLYSAIAAAGSNFVESYGWELPAAYADVLSEYQAATTGVGVYDASHLGLLAATGGDVLDLLHRLSTNSVIALEPSQGATTILTTDRGRILDVIIVAHAGDHYLLLTSPGMSEQVGQFLDRYTIMEDITVENISASSGALALWGPASRTFLHTAAGASVGDLPPYHTLVADLLGYRIRIVGSAMSDLPGYYLICPAEEIQGLWERVIKAGATPMGEEAYELARINSGVPAQGHDLGEEYNPLEAGLIGSIDFTKGCYIGQEVIARLDSYKKVQKHLVKVLFGPDAVVSPGAVLTQAGKPVGKVTSVARNPASGTFIGLAYVRPGQAIAGAQLDLEPPATGTARVEALSQMFGPGQE